MDKPEFNGFRYSVTYPDHKYKPRVCDFCKGCSHCKVIYQYTDGGTMRNPEPGGIITYLCDAQLEDRLVFIGNAGKEGYPVGCPPDILNSKLEKILELHIEDLKSYDEFLKFRDGIEIDC